MIGRIGRLLTWKRACFFSALLVALYVAAYVYSIANGHPPLNAGGEPIGGDWIAFHTAGRMVLTGQAAHMYDHAAVVAVQDELLHGAIPGFYDAYRNPPFFALLFVPFAAFDLVPAFAAWTVVSLAVLAVGLALLHRSETHSVRLAGIVLVIAAFAPLYFGLIDGQNSTLSLLLFALVYLSLALHRDTSAGAWAALGLFKPQLFLVFPIIFLATSRWRALATYAATALALVAISLALVGAEGIQSWLRILTEIESGNATRNAWRMHSLKSFFDTLLPAQPTLSLALYAVASLGLITILIATWRKGQPPAQIFGLTAVTAVLVDPHLVDYDLTVLIAAGLIATAAVATHRWWIALLYVLLLFRAQLPLGDTAALDLTVIVLCYLAVALARSAYWHPILVTNVPIQHPATTLDPIR